MTWSDDNLQTWSPAHTLVLPAGALPGQRPYAKYATNGTDTIYFTFDDGHPRDIPTNSVYFMSLKGGEFYRADGTPIASLASVTGSDGTNGGAGVPISNTAADLVYNGGGPDGKAWVQDIAVGANGRPVILFATFPNDSNHRYHYAAWNGTAWQDNDFTGGGGSIATIGGETEYSGGLSLDHNDPSIVYTSRQHGTSGTEWEIQRWTTPDGGTTFSGPVSITANSTVKNVRPVVPWGPPGPVKLLWMSGTYTHWKGLYDTSIQMLTTTRAPTTARISVSAPAVPSNQAVTVTARAVFGFGGVPSPGMTAALFARPAGAADYARIATVARRQPGAGDVPRRAEAAHPLSRTVRQHADGHRIAGAERGRRAEGRDGQPHHGLGADTAGRPHPAGHRSVDQRRQRSPAGQPAGDHPEPHRRVADLDDVRPGHHQQAGPGHVRRPHGALVGAPRGVPVAGHSWAARPARR